VAVIEVEVSPDTVVTDPGMVAAPVVAVVIKNCTSDSDLAASPAKAIAIPHQAIPNVHPRDRNVPGIVPPLTD
jgi:hypothetical protein